MKHRFRKQQTIVAALVLAVGGFAFSALAGRKADDRSVAMAVLSQRVSSSAIPASRQALTQAQHALFRADQARAAGDEVNAKLLEGLAREWAELATDSERAAQAELRADQSQKAAASASIPSAALSAARLRPPRPASAASATGSQPGGQP